MNSFYQKLQQNDFSIQHVTKGAFSRCRSKLKPEAFAELNQVGIQSFYTNAPWRSFQGLRLLAVDGSTAVLPNHPSVIEEFGVTNFGPYAASPRSVARTSVLYDVLNLTAIDARIGRYDKSERQLATEHFDFVKPGQDLLLFDRGYPSLGLMFEMQARGIDYLIRMRKDWWLEVRKMLAAGEKDKEVVFYLPASEKDLQTKYNQSDTKIRCRLISIPLANGETEVLCTSVADKKILPYNCFGELYHYRWNIEEGYKLLKCRLQLEAFSGKTALAVKQDFFAKIFTLTTTAVMAFPVEEQLKKEEAIKERKHPCQVNRTNALSMFKEIAAKVILAKMIRPAIEAFDKILKHNKEIIRPNRTFKRKKLKKKPHSMNYKQL